ncbi:MAG TPA: hypothetical protein VMS55_14590 [Myxococcota bacterium]|nr:hypothetical protein [Myxococcota bacterium]
MTTTRVLIASGVIVLLAIASLAAAVVGFFVGYTYATTREAQTDAGITVGALVRLRDGRFDEGIKILETDLRSDFLSHWGGFRFEDSVPEVWLFGPLNLGGLAYAASYLEEHPDPIENGFVDQIVACFRRPNLPDPRDEMLAHRKAIRACYESVR